MKDKGLLMLPGPTTVPPGVLQEMSTPMINHRGEEFSQLFAQVVQGLREILQTASSDILLFPAAGTGAMEAVIVNLFSPGDKVLVGDAGVFGARFAAIARNFGLDVETIRVERGADISPDMIENRLSRDKGKNIRAVIVTHNETSTGVTNNIRDISRARGNHPALLVVDAVSSLGALDLQMDNWDIDAVLCGSQKALMVPPGLAVVALRSRAWERVENSAMSKYYWDFELAKKYGKKGQTPYTPAISQLFALRRALAMIEREGLQQVFKRHSLLGRAARAGIKQMGLKLFAREEAASDTVTAFCVSREIGGDTLRMVLLERYGLTVAGGQQELKNKILRIGHLGFVGPLDIIAALGALEMSLAECGYNIELGRGVGAAQKIILEGGNVK